MFINASQILMRAIRCSVNHGGAIWGTVKPVAFDNKYTSSREKFTDGYGIEWFDEVHLFWHNDGHVTPYMGTIQVKCNGVAGEKNWYHQYGITVDGQLILWAC